MMDRELAVGIPMFGMEERYIDRVTCHKDVSVEVSTSILSFMISMDQNS